MSQRPVDHVLRAGGASVGLVSVRFSFRSIPRGSEHSSGLWDRRERCRDVATHSRLEFVGCGSHGCRARCVGASGCGKRTRGQTGEMWRRDDGMDSSEGVFDEARKGGHRGSTSIVTKAEGGKEDAGERTSRGEKRPSHFLASLPVNSRPHSVSRGESTHQNGEWDSCCTTLRFTSHQPSRVSLRGHVLSYPSHPVNVRRTPYNLRLGSPPSKRPLYQSQHTTARRCRRSQRQRLHRVDRLDDAQRSRRRCRSDGRQPIRHEGLLGPLLVLDRPDALPQVVVDGLVEVGKVVLGDGADRVEVDRGGKSRDEGAGDEVCGAEGSAGALEAF